MKVLITGGSGFIGRHLSAVLINAGYSVNSVNRKQGTDVTQWTNVQKLEPVDIVIHLAGSIGREVEPREHYYVNCVGTFNLLEYSRLHKIRSFIFASSYVYGTPEYLPVDESHPTGGKGMYVASKLMAEDLCLRYSKEFDLPVVALRIFNAYGPFQSGSLLIPTLLSQLRVGQEAVLKDPKPKRDFVFIDDVVDAFGLAVRHTMPGFHVYNVASGASISVKELAVEIQKAWEGKVSISFTGEERDHEIQDSQGSAELITQQLGWWPRVSLSEGIRRTVEWWKHR